MSRITREDVERTAALAHIALGEEEIVRMTRDLDRVLEHADELAKIDTDGILPTAHAMALATPTREDLAEAAIDPGLAVRTAPQAEGSAFVVPKVIKGEER